MLRHLKSFSADESVLTRVYTTYVRPVLEYCAPAIFPLMTQTDVSNCESVQRIALKMIYGFEAHYEEILEKSKLSTLQERLFSLTKNFAKRAVLQQTGKKWFPKPVMNNNMVETRNVPKVREFPARTEIRQKSPLYYMRRILNGG